MATGERLSLARTAQGLDVTTISDQTGIAQNRITSYERGLRQPEPEEWEILAAAVGTTGAFLQLDNPIAVMTPVSDRFSQVEPSDARNQLLAQIVLWAERNVILEGASPESDLRLAVFPEGYAQDLPDDHAQAAAADAAEEIRHLWGLGGHTPIRYLSDQLESLGIRVAFVPGVEGFDAASFMATAQDIDFPLVAVNAWLDGDLQRFAMARELAYLLLGNLDRGIAGHFAGGLLLPAQAMTEEFGEKREMIETYDIYIVKHKYGVSMRFIIARLASLRILSPDAAKELIDFYHEQGWDDGEPGDPYPPEQPNRQIKRALRLQLSGELSPELCAELVGMSLGEWISLINFGVIPEELYT